MSPDGLIEERSIHVPHSVLIYIVLRSFKSCLCAAADNFPHFHAKRTFMSRLSITVIIFLVFNFGIEIKKSIINKSWYWSRVSNLPKMILEGSIMLYRKIESRDLQEPIFGFEPVLGFVLWCDIVEIRRSSLCWI